MRQIVAQNTVEHCVDFQLDFSNLSKYWWNQQGDTFWSLYWACLWKLNFNLRSHHVEEVVAVVVEVKMCFVVHSPDSEEDHSVRDKLFGLEKQELQCLYRSLSRSLSLKFVLVKDISTVWGNFLMSYCKDKTQRKILYVTFVCNGCNPGLLGINTLLKNNICLSILCIVSRLPIPLPMFINSTIQKRL